MFFDAIVKEYRSGNGAVFETINARLEALNGTTASAWRATDFVDAMPLENPPMSAIYGIVYGGRKMVAAMWAMNGVPFPNATFPNLERTWLAYYALNSALPDRPLKPSQCKKVHLSSDMDGNAVQFWSNLAHMAQLGTERYDEEKAEYGEIDEELRDEKLAKEKVAARRQEEEARRTADAAASGGK